MYCHVPMTQAMVTLNDTLNPDFGTGIEKHHLKKQQSIFFFSFCICKPVGTRQANASKKVNRKLLS